MGTWGVVEGSVLFSVSLLPEPGPGEAQVCQVVSGDASHSHGQRDAPDPGGCGCKNCGALGQEDACPSCQARQHRGLALIIGSLACHLPCVQACKQEAGSPGREGKPGPLGFVSCSSFCQSYSTANIYSL